MNLPLNILPTLTARVFLLGLALVSSVALARVLGPEGRGLFALALLLPEWSKNLGLLGFEQAYAVYAGLEPERRRSLVWQGMAIAGLVGGVFALGAVAYLLMGAPGLPGLERGPRWLFFVPLAAIPVWLLTEYWFAILRGMNRILLLNIVEVSTKVASVTLILIMLLGFRFGVVGAVWADVLACLGTAAVIGYLLQRAGVWGRPSFDRGLWRRTAAFALPAYGGTAAAYINYRAGEMRIAVWLIDSEQNSSTI